MVHDARLGHPGGDFSAADILAALYFQVLRIDPRRPHWPDRDRFILSKGHCSASVSIHLHMYAYKDTDALASDS